MRRVLRWVAVVVGVVVALGAAGVIGAHSLGGVAAARYGADETTDASGRMIVEASAGVITAAGT